MCDISNTHQWLRCSTDNRDSWWLSTKLSARRSSILSGGGRLLEIDIGFYEKYRRWKLRRSTLCDLNLTIAPYNFNRLNHSQAESPRNKKFRGLYRQQEKERERERTRAGGKSKPESRSPNLVLSSPNGRRTFKHSQKHDIAQEIHLFEFRKYAFLQSDMLKSSYLGVF